MAKKITWSPLAKATLREILLSSVERQGNKQEAKRVFSLLESALYRISKNPFIGSPTEIENIRYLSPYPDYTVFYRHSLQQIEVLVLWNNRYKLGRIETVAKENG